jgi:hypothetical protein
MWLLSISSARGSRAFCPAGRAERQTLWSPGARDGKDSVPRADAPGGAPPPTFPAYARCRSHAPPLAPARHSGPYLAPERAVVPHYSSPGEDGYFA